MNLISMATTGLKEFASKVKSTVLTTLTGSSSYQNTFDNNLKIATGILGLVNSNKGTSLAQGLSNLVSSNAGNLGAKHVDDGIYEFLEHFKNGVMKSSRFRAEFTLPSGVVASNNTYAVNPKAFNGTIKGIQQSFNSNGTINIKCHTVTFPNRNINVTKIRINNTMVTVPQYVDYDPISLTFYADGAMDTRSYIELWQSCVINFGNNTMNYYNEYTSDIKLYVQNDEGKDVYGIILYEAYPQQLSPLEMSYGSSNMPLNVMCMFCYKSWLPLSNNQLVSRTV